MPGSAVRRQTRVPSSREDGPFPAEMRIHSPRVPQGRTPSGSARGTYVSPSTAQRCQMHSGDLAPFTPPVRLSRLSAGERVLFLPWNCENGKYNKLEPSQPKGSCSVSSFRLLLAWVTPRLTGEGGNLLLLLLWLANFVWGI